VKKAAQAIVGAVKSLWSLIHGYDDIRGATKDTTHAPEPTAEELAAARRLAGQEPPTDEA
jgi:hypothetical protein